jgi:hypothetical protein
MRKLRKLAGAGAPTYERLWSRMSRRSIPRSWCTYIPLFQGVIEDLTFPNCTFRFTRSITRYDQSLLNFYAETTPPTEAGRRFCRMKIHSAISWSDCCVFVNVPRKVRSGPSSWIRVRVAPVLSENCMCMVRLCRFTAGILPNFNTRYGGS